jgi:hypothetical protein
MSPPRKNARKTINPADDEEIERVRAEAHNMFANTDWKT